MAVLTVLGVLLGIILVFVLVMKFNAYTYNKYKYEFFEVWSYVLASISDALIYFGNSSYETAILKNGDILDGQLLILFGIIGLIILVSINISKTGIIIGIIGSIFQLILYAALAVIGFIAIIFLMAFFLQTKPVFSINSRD